MCLSVHYYIRSCRIRFPPPSILIETLQQTHCICRLLLFCFFLQAYTGESAIDSCQCENKMGNKTKQKVSPSLSCSSRLLIISRGISHTERERQTEPRACSIFSHPAFLSCFVSSKRLFIGHRARPPTAGGVRSGHTHTRRERERQDRDREKGAMAIDPQPWTYIRCWPTVNDCQAERNGKCTKREEEFLFLMKEMDRLFTS